MLEIRNQIPNILTVIRIFLAVLSSYFAIEHDTWSLIISLGFFLLASLTDFLDGFLARKWKIVSNFGKLIDPIADKILLLGVLFSFSLKGVFPLLFTIVIASREVLLTIIRIILLPKKIVLASEWSGKLKTTVQIVSVIMVYIILIFLHPLRHAYGKVFVEQVIYFIVAISMIVTLYSGYDFFRMNRKILYKTFF